MSKTLRNLIKKIVWVILFLGLVFGFFYMGVIFGKGEKIGFFNLFREQGINVLFGIIGGLITTALVGYLQSISKDYRYLSKDDKFLTDTWDEKYIPEDFPEDSQEQLLCFHLQQKGDRISGQLIGTDSPSCPPDKRHGYRKFNIEGRKEGNLVSLIAVIDDDKKNGHIVYLLEIIKEGSVLKGETSYIDQNHNVLTSASTKLIRKVKT